jgi:hypothetical protein
MKYLFAFLIANLALAQDSSPARTVGYGPPAVSNAVQGVLAEMNLPLDSVLALRITTRTIETDTSVLSPYIKDSVRTRTPGWQRSRIRLAFDLIPLKGQRTKLILQARIDRFGVPNALMLIPPAWTSARSNEVLEGLVLSAIEDRLTTSSGSGRKQ